MTWRETLLAVFLGVAVSGLGIPLLAFAVTWWVKAWHTAFPLFP
jgi:hypothetical protein